MTVQPGVNITQVGGVDTVSDGGRLPVSSAETSFLTLVELRVISLILVDAYQLQNSPDRYREAVMADLNNVR